jgi:hypothetical protein
LTPSERTLATPANLANGPAAGATSKRLVPIALLGAALNILAYGFLYGQDNHDFELAMLNWIRDPTLYPGDAILGGFIRYPAIFWRAVALVPRAVSTEAVLFAVFLLTKFLFFIGVVWIARFATSDARFVRLATLLVALAPALNRQLPFGAVRLLDPIQTQSPLAIAVLVVACAALLDGRWMLATVLAAASIYLSVPYTVFALFAFVALAVVDVKSRPRTVVLSGFLGAVLMVPWLVMNLPLLRQHDPPDYVQALLLFYPLHLKWSTHHRVDFVYGPAFLLCVLIVVLWAHKKRCAPDRRLETMAAAFFVPVLIGVVAGQVHLTPLLGRMQLMRADAFLFLFSAMVLFAAVYRLARNRAIRFPRVTLPAAFLLFAMPVTPLHLCLLILGLVLAFWSECREFLRAYLGGRGGARSHPIARVIALAMVALLFAGLLAETARSTPFTGMFSIPGSTPSDWAAVQLWARDNTPRDAVFLVPTFMEGFRVLSQRSSWGEWKDGTAVYWYQPLADTYISRMRDVGWTTAPDLNGRGTVQQRYKALPWTTLLALARDNHLQYIVQYRDVSYPDAPPPVYVNPSFAVYRVQP